VKGSLHDVRITMNGGCGMSWRIFLREGDTWAIHKRMNVNLASEQFGRGNNTWKE
jgi:hypothetical protein